jgi:Leucine-rich repeat (LRR) protein
MPRYSASPAEAPKKLHTTTAIQSPLVSSVAKLLHQTQFIDIIDWAEIATVCKAFSEKNAISRSLDAWGTCFSMDAFRQLFRQHSQLTIVDLGGCALSPRLNARLGELGQELTGLNRLTRLNLSHNRLFEWLSTEHEPEDSYRERLRPVQFPAFKALLGPPSLVELDLSFNQSTEVSRSWGSDSEEPDFLEPLAGSLMGLPLLSKLVLSHNHMGFADGGKALAIVLQNNAVSPITDLDVSCNWWPGDDDERYNESRYDPIPSYGKEFAKELFAGLQNRPTSLVRLNLADNMILAKGTELLAAVVLEHPNLTDLNISRCYCVRDHVPGSYGSEYWHEWGATLKLDGLRALCEAIQTLKCLTLDISGNGIGAEGLELVASAFPSLSVLNLSENKLMTGEAGKIFEIALAMDGCNLRELDVSCNGFNFEDSQEHTYTYEPFEQRFDFFQKLAAGVRECASLRKLALCGDTCEVTSKSDRPVRRIVLDIDMTTLDLKPAGGDRWLPYTGQFWWDNEVKSRGKAAYPHYALMRHKSYEKAFEQKHYHDLGSGGLQVVAAFLDRCTNLTSLNLSTIDLCTTESDDWCEETDEGGEKAMAAAIKSCSTLQILDISRCWLLSAHAFASAIEDHPSLIEITFSSSYDCMPADQDCTVTMTPHTDEAQFSHLHFCDFGGEALLASCRGLKKAAAAVGCTDAGLQFDGKH